MYLNHVIHILGMKITSLTQIGPELGALASCMLPWSNCDSSVEHRFTGIESRARVLSVAGTSSP